METHTLPASLVHVPPAELAEKASPYGALTDFVKHMDALKAVADALSKSTLLPKAMQHPANLQLVLAQGIEMGFTPIQAIRASFIIESKDQPPKVGYYVESLVALVRRSGVCRFFRVEVMTGEKCRVVCARKDEAEDIVHVFELTMAEASKANLDKKWEWDDKEGKRVAKTKYTWITAPSDMLRARTCGRAVKAVFQDVIFGMATPDELDAVSDANVIEMMEAGANRWEPVPDQAAPTKPATSSPPAAAVKADADAIDKSGAVDVVAQESGSGDPAWDGALECIARVLKWPAGNIANWGPDDLKEEFDRRALATESRAELNKLGPWISEVAKGASRSKTCADVAAHLRETFNQRNDELRKSAKGAA